MKMKPSAYNPTAYFFQQSEQQDNRYMKEINEFVQKLLNFQNCQLCQEQFNFNTRMPRILIHCGHTFCTQCLQRFLKNFRVRCPMCLKLIRNIETIERLPINHTIFAKMAEIENEKNKNNPNYEKINIQEVLYASFVASQNNRQDGQQQLDPNFNQIPAEMIQEFIKMQIQQQQSMMSKDGVKMNNFFELQPTTQEQQEQALENLESCELHDDRIKHFYCILHKTITCRACTQQNHAKEDCMIADLYDVEDIPNFLKIAASVPDVNQQQSSSQQQQQQQPQPMATKQMPQQQQQQQFQQQQANLNYNKQIENENQDLKQKNGGNFEKKQNQDIYKPIYVGEDDEDLDHIRAVEHELHAGEEDNDEDYYDVDDEDENAQDDPKYAHNQNHPKMPFNNQNNNEQQQSYEYEDEEDEEDEQNYNDKVSNHSV